VECFLIIINIQSGESLSAFLLHYCNLKTSGCLFRKVTCAPTPWYRTPHQLLHPATTRVPYPLTQLCLRLSIFYWIYISSILYAAPFVFKLRLDERFLEHFYASRVLKSIATDRGIAYSFYHLVLSNVFSACCWEKWTGNHKTWWYNNKIDKYGFQNQTILWTSSSTAFTLISFDLKVAINALIEDILQGVKLYTAFCICSTVFFGP